MPKRTCPHITPGMSYIKLAIPDELDEESQRDQFLSALMKTPDDIELDFNTVHRCVEHPLADSYFWVVAVKRTS